MLYCEFVTTELGWGGGMRMRSISNELEGTRAEAVNAAQLRSSKHNRSGKLFHLSLFSSLFSLKIVFERRTVIRNRVEYLFRTIEIEYIS